MEIRERTINEEDFCTVLNENTSLKGELRCRQPILINCEFEGTVISENLVIIYQKGVFKGNVKARTIRISGKIIGDLFANELVDLENTAHVHGNIFSPTIQMAPGAIFEGQSHIVRRVGSDSEKNTAAALLDQKNLETPQQLEHSEQENSKKSPKKKVSQAYVSQEKVSNPQTSETGKVSG